MIIPWLENIYQKGKQWQSILISLIFTIMLLDNVISTRDTKTHLKKAGQWTQQHHPQAKKIMINDNRLSYYTNNLLNPQTCNINGNEQHTQKTKSYQHYDLIILRIRKQPTPLYQTLKTTPNIKLVKEIHSPKKREQIAIFHNQNPKPNILCP